MKSNQSTMKKWWASLRRIIDFCQSAIDLNLMKLLAIRFRSTSNECRIKLNAIMNRISKYCKNVFIQVRRKWEGWLGINKNRKKVLGSEDCNIEKRKGTRVGLLELGKKTVWQYLKKWRFDWIKPQTIEMLDILIS